MKYAKPAVAVLGQAVRVIESHSQKPPRTVFETLTTKQAPAYDLDE
jgi:hypothetical protein